MVPCPWQEAQESALDLKVMRATVLCLGLDPSRELMRDWGLGDDAESLHRFCGVMMEVAGDRIAAVKRSRASSSALGRQAFRNWRGRWR
jgi:hypothetical protein